MIRSASSSLQTFIGREQTLADIRSRIGAQSGAALISVQGQGGVGKTYLLRQLYDEHNGQQGLLCFAIIDFYQVRNRNIRWVMDSLASQAPGLFPRFYSLQHQASAASSARAAWPVTTMSLIEAFRADLAQIAQRYRCVMFFDTIELIQETVIADLLQIMVSTKNNVFILAGRHDDALLPKFNAALGSHAVLKVALAGFSEQNAITYIQQVPAGRDLTDQEQHVLYLLADNGVPIKLALALDWLARGLALRTLVASSYVDLLELRENRPEAFRQRQQEFERELVLQIGELGNALDRAVHMMAHTSMRFNRALLVRLLQPDSPDQLLDELRRLPFVRRIGEDTLVLHDEVQRMILHNIWDLEDPTYEERRTLSEAVIAYYDEAITSLEAAPGSAGPITVDELRIERLHYRFDVDVSQGYHDFSKIFEQHKDSRDLDDIEIAALALDVLLRNRSLPGRLREFANTYHRGWVLTRRTELEQAQSCVAAGLARLTTAERRPIAAPELREFLEREVDRRIGEVYTLYGYTCRLAGEWSEAVQWYERARELNERQIDALAASDPSAAGELWRSLSRLAETLNDIANLQRLQGNLDDARLYCKTSLLLRRMLKETLRSGHSCYVMSMVLWEAGNTSEVLSYLRQARACYRETGAEALERAWVDRYHGYVLYRTGHIPEAIDRLSKALQAADHANLPEEQAQALLIFSRIKRDRGTPDDLLEAERIANEALAIARRAANDYIVAEAHLTQCLTMHDLARLEPSNTRYPSAFNTHFDQGVEIANRRGYARLQILFSQICADQAFERSDYRQAFADYLRACELSLRFKPSVFHRAISLPVSRLYELVETDPGQAIRACQQIRHAWNAEREPDENYGGLIEAVGMVEALARHRHDRSTAAQRFEEAFHRGAWHEALKACDEADRIPLDQYVERADVMVRRAEAHHSSNQLAQARLFADQALRIYTRLANPSPQLADSHLLLGTILWKIGMTAEGAAHFDRAEAQHKSLGSIGGGLGRVYVEQAYAAFRAHLFDDARRLLHQALRIFQRDGADVQQAVAWTVLSRVERADPGSAEERLGSYENAERYGNDALLILRGQDWFAEAEIHLTLCILYYVWGLSLRPTDPLQAAVKFRQALEQNAAGLKRIAQIESPMLRSVYEGMRANLLLVSGDRVGARAAFLEELVAATRTKHMRLMRALDLLEDFLVAEPPEMAQEHADWLVAEWQARGLDRTYPQVSKAITWIFEHQRYILLAQRSQESSEL